MVFSFRSLLFLKKFSRWLHLTFFGRNYIEILPKIFVVYKWSFCKNGMCSQSVTVSETADIARFYLTSDHFKPSMQVCIAEPFVPLFYLEV